MKHVVIVGGGMAGLTAARHLLRRNDHENNKSTLLLRVTLVEASDVLGGRIRGDSTFLPAPHILDVGAEFLHGRQTLLTELVDEYYSNDEWQQQYSSIRSRNDLLQEIFITAHADGGPSDGPTRDGYYGMYYIEKQLVPATDARLQPLHGALDELQGQVCTDPTTSLGDVLLQPKDRLLSAELQSLAVAGYANTAGCTDLCDISLSVTLDFERHWEENEVEGDDRIHSHVGMIGVVQALSKQLKSFGEAFHLHLGWRVCSTRIDREEGKVLIKSSDGKQLEADAVIVTVPPPLLEHLGLDLPSDKRDALKHIGFETVVKIVLKFSKRLWPDKLQSVVCSESILPEVWFRDFPDHTSSCEEESSSHGDCFVAVGFLTSQLARDFLQMVNVQGKASLEKATELVISQLAEMFDLPVSEFVTAHTGSLLYDWGSHPTIQGGYMYPKVGLTRKHIRDLAAPIGRVFFAGEATNVNACCTVQAAMETGVRAANQVCEALRVK